MTISSSSFPRRIWARATRWSLMVPSEQPPASPRRAAIILNIRLRRWSMDSSSSSEDGMEIGKRFYSFRFPKWPNLDCPFGRLRDHRTRRQTQRGAKWRPRGADNWIWQKRFLFSLQILDYNFFSALICFGYYQSRASCELFDGTTSTATFSTSAAHYYGGLAFYNGSPATVGSFNLASAAAESLSASEWTDLPNFPT